jgi:anti-anti-sigma factor
VIEVHARERVIVFAGHGEWDLATAPALRAQLGVALAGAWQLIVVDLKDVTLLDVAGVDPIVHAVDRSRATGQEVVLVHPQPPVAQLLDLIGLGDRVAPTETLPHIGELLDALNG